MIAASGTIEIQDLSGKDRKFIYGITEEESILVYEPKKLEWFFIKSKHAARCRALLNNQDKCTVVPDGFTLFNVIDALTQNVFEFAKILKEK